MAGQPPRIAYNPPVIHHPEQTKFLSSDEAQPLLAKYLEKSRKAPHLHPDAWLFTDGIQFGPKGGPSGGWAMHHLRRIEAGLRGEQLEAESREELVAKFGEDAVPSTFTTYATSEGYEDAIGDQGVGTSDDARLDEVIADSQAKTNDFDKKRRKQEKRDRIEREKAAKRVKLDDSDAAMSGANTPYQDSMVGHGDTWKKGEDDGESGWEDKAEYEQRQEVWEGDVADGDPTHGRAATSPPVVVTHDEAGKVIMPKKEKTAQEKAEKKAAKRLRRAEERGCKGESKRNGQKQWLKGTSFKAKPAQVKAHR